MEPIEYTRTEAYEKARMLVRLARSILGHMRLILATKVKSEATSATVNADREDVARLLYRARQFRELGRKGGGRML